MAVLWNNDVVPFCNDYNKELVLGNAPKENLAEIWNGSALQGLRHECIRNTVSNPCAEIVIN